MAAAPAAAGSWLGGIDRRPAHHAGVAAPARRRPAHAHGDAEAAGGRTRHARQRRGGAPRTAPGLRSIHASWSVARRHGRRHRANVQRRAGRCRPAPTSWRCAAAVRTSIWRATSAISTWSTAAVARRAGAAWPLTARLDALIALTRTMVEAMDFGVLFDADRQLLSIGYRVGDGTLDPSCYDLLASEARLASFVAIAKGDVPTRHWFHLGRAVTPVHGGAALISWSGSMFEYLMPALVMRAPAGSLLDETNRIVVRPAGGIWRRRAVSRGACRNPRTTRAIRSSPTSTRASASPASDSSADLATTRWWRRTRPRWPR